MRSTENPWLHRFAVFTAFATLALIGVGGLVTSHGAGMAVPDWPTSYGYNMFLLPFSYWVGGIFYEHTHRLVASAVGLFTAILAVWLWLKEERRWLRGLGALALVGVIGQGVLGGLRVTLFKDELGIFHATLAQLFFVLVSFIALFTSQWWRLAARHGFAFSVSKGLSLLIATATMLILVQLILGATMRHQHAGLAVPDFPLAYGKIWPPLDAGSIKSYNVLRTDVRNFNSITAFQIGLHMAHRLVALLIVAAVTLSFWRLWAEVGAGNRMYKFAACWWATIVMQAVLGAVTVLSNKAADIATAHVVIGAVSLVLGAVLALITSRCSCHQKSVADAREHAAKNIMDQARPLASTP